MDCPKCNSANVNIINSRQCCEYRRRRYKCLDCDNRFSTVEVVVPTLQRVESVTVNYKPRYKRVLEWRKINAYECVSGTGQPDD